LDSTVDGVGGLWPWYSNGVASDPSNSLSVFLEGVRDADTHRMNHNTSNPGSLGQTSGSTTYDYTYTGIPGGGNDDSTKGVVLKYTATEEREILIETTGGDWNDAVIVIFTEAHLNGGSAPFRVVTADAGDPETFNVKFPYSTNNSDANIYYIAFTSNRSSDLSSGTPLKVTAAPTTYSVTNTLDDGSTGSFRSAIISANASSTINSIVFDSGVSGTITLASNLPSITSDLTITGPESNTMLLIVDEAFAEMIADLKDPVLPSSRVFVTEYVVGAAVTFNGVPELKSEDLFEVNAI
jgi:hypothetical protein